MDRWTALNVFRAATEEGSFAAAARKLGLSPAAVSKNIGELEDELSVRLFHRTTRRMSLTAEGALYYEKVTPALEALIDADAEISAIGDRPRGHLRISAPVSLTLTRISAELPRFLRDYPELEVSLHLDDRRCDLINDGFDLALRGSDHLEDSSLIARKITVLDHVICGSPGYFEAHTAPTHPEDLRDHELIKFTLSGHADVWTFTQGRHEVRLPVEGRYSVGSSLAVRDALRAGFGLSLIPRLYVQEDLAEGRLSAVLKDWKANETTLYAVYPSRRLLVPKVRVFIAFLKELFATRSAPG